jgi:predicted Zn-dependent peptidase
MKKIITFIFMGVISLNSYSQPSELLDPENINIPFKKYVLDNGLRLIVHEDHKVPIAAVNIWYHVGSKNEKSGKTGFAHLFEHLMFNGSENYNKDYFMLLESIGATDMNGTTNSDRTNYFQNVPVSALDQVLWLESDRMGHLLGAVDQARLDEQRGVVQNEKRQGENQPYGREYEMSTKASFPAGHPYSWTVIGSMEDLEAASLEDVNEWFKSYYGAANAVLVIAGDVDPEDIYQRVKKYFGNIPSGPTIKRYDIDIAKRIENTRQSYLDRVSEPRISMYWNVAQWGTDDAAFLDLASKILSDGKSSRLYKKLVYEDQIASSAYSYNYSRQISGTFNITINVKPEMDLNEVEMIANDILEDFITNGPSEDELLRAKADIFSGFIKGIERIGGFGGKSDILAESEVYGKDPEFYKTYLNQLANANITDIHEAVKMWLNSGKHTIVCEPFPEFFVTGEEADRSKLPDFTEQPPSSFPDLETATLRNGLNIVLARREKTPTVSVDILFDAGYASDQFAVAGTSSLAMNLMDEGTESYTALQISDKLQLLGGNIFAFSNLDNSVVRMNTLLASFDESMEIFSDIILNPVFSQNEFERLKKEQINAIRREQTQPFSMALRIFPKFIYGEGHAYSQPFTGSGYEDEVEKLTRDDMLNFYNTWIKPNNATLVVVGDVNMKTLKEKVNNLFKDWKEADIPVKNISAVANLQANNLYLLDRPESEQSVLITGYSIDPYGKVSEVATQTMMNILGGDFTSRINMNIREDKHWSYGAGATVIDAKGPRPMLAFTSVQRDKSKESIVEIIKEFNDIVGSRPVTEEEFNRVKENMIMQLPGRWETNNAVLNSVNEIVTYDLPDDYYQKYDQDVRSLDLNKVQTVTKEVIKPGKITYFVVGDKEKILSSLEELDVNEIIFVDPNGNPLQPSGKIDNVIK